MKYKSKAEWSIAGISEDTHQSREMAEGVCHNLIAFFGTSTPGCDIRGKCKKAWVEEVVDGE